MTVIQWKFQTEDEAFTKAFTKHKYNPPNFSFIAWNMRRPFFDDMRVRKAMAMLIDKETILKTVMFGEAYPITGPFYRLGPNYANAIEPYPYDPAKAAALLDAAGWKDTDGDGLRDRDGVPFKFRLFMRSGERASRSIALILRSELKKVGVDMEIVPLEWTTMVDFIFKRNFDAASLAFQMPVEEDAYPVWHSSSADTGSNFFGLKDPKIDMLVERARTEFDAGTRAVIFHEVQKRLYELQPCAFLFSMPSFTSIAKRFENVIDYKLGPDMYEWKVGPGPVLREW
jgi:peptide/nickel transport system substrate-binding protein